MRQQTTTRQCQQTARPRGWGYTGQPIWSWHPFWSDPMIGLAWFAIESLAFYVKHEISSFPKYGSNGKLILVDHFDSFPPDTLNFKPFVFDWDHWYFDVQQLRYVLENVFRLDRKVITLSFWHAPYPWLLFVVAYRDAPPHQISNMYICIYIHIFVIHIHICTIQW